MGKILILTSSGRTNSNSTAMAESFAEGARQFGHETTIVNAIDLNIKPCRGCESCRKNENRCCVDDDFNELAAKIEEAETIVLACPVYWYDFPAQMKLVIDKFIAFLWSKKPTSPKQMVLLSCAQETDEAYVFAGIDTAFECTAEHLGWPVAAKIERGGIDHEGDVNKSDVLDVCFELGKSL